MELRDIEIFLTLAEELHFGRTAQRLHVSQARVSQAIKTQERRIGAPLFERSSRAVRLTPLGDRLRSQLQPAYQGILAAIDDASSTARGISGQLTLGTMGAMARAVDNVVSLFQTRYPSADVRFREVHPPDPFAGLRSGEVDAALLWLPVREPDLVVGPVLRVSPIMLMAAPTHPLGGRDEVSLEDVAHHHVLAPRGPIPRYMEEALVPFETPTGRPIPRGEQVGTWQEVLTAVAAGRAVALAQYEAASFFPWPDIRYIPISDHAPSQWALVWPKATETALIRALAQAARDIGVHTG
ncbi:MAG: LysR family transcriptional regulator [Hamadaea sp.]|nr:LysR family transcriptional regulator [Hamadaea sp.]